MDTVLALRDMRHLVGSDIAVEPPSGLYGYEKSLWAAGVKVWGWEEFGSYQGDWWSLVEFPNGERYFIHDYYGSCSGCDAFQSEFMLVDDDDREYLHKLRDFGREYLSDCMTYEQAVSKASENLEWDHDAAEMVAWIKDTWAKPTLPNTQGKA